MKGKSNSNRKILHWYHNVILMFNGKTWEALPLKSKEEANAQLYLTLFSKQ